MDSDDSDMRGDKVLWAKVVILTESEATSSDNVDCSNAGVIDGRDRRVVLTMAIWGRDDYCTSDDDSRSGGR